MLILSISKPYVLLNFLLKTEIYLILILIKVKSDNLYNIVCTIMRLGCENLINI